MSKPNVKKIIPFDANYEYIVSMSYNGNLPYSNRIIIYDATIEALETVATGKPMFLLL